MFLSTGIFTILFLLGLVLGEDSDPGSILRIFGIAAVVAIPTSLILGYLFVGLSLLLYRLLIQIGFVNEEDKLHAAIAESQPDPPLNA
jgi:hypothetical protein